MTAPKDPTNAPPIGRLVPYTADPAAIAAMRGVEDYIHSTGLDEGLIELIKVRASQMNGCAYCLHLHIAKAIENGESDVRLHLLSAWHESTLYTPRERAALAWCEALTQVTEHRASDDLYQATAAHFPGNEMIHLTMVISTINAWNRIMIAFNARHPNDKPAV